MSKYRYLTFDCYGTLIDWKTGIQTALRSALGDKVLDGGQLLSAYVEAEKAEEAVYKRYREVLRLAVQSTAEVLGADISESVARRFAASVPSWPAFSDTATFLADMGAKGYRRYILSNVDNDLLQETIRRNNLQVDGFVTAEEVGSYKPRLAHWQKFLRTTGASKESVLHVAQSVYHDIVPARRMGIDSAWVNRYDERLPRDAVPNYMTDSLAHLGELLDAARP